MQRHARPYANDSTCVVRKGGRDPCPFTTTFRYAAGAPLVIDRLRSSPYQADLCASTQVREHSTEARRVFQRRSDRRFPLALRSLCVTTAKRPASLLASNATELDATSLHLMQLDPCRPTLTCDSLVLAVSGGESTPARSPAPSSPRR
jgi:hypothetical protein